MARSKCYFVDGAHPGRTWPVYRPSQLRAPAPRLDVSQCLPPALIAVLSHYQAPFFHHQQHNAALYSRPIAALPLAQSNAAF
jgi:hypothetical protein